MKDTLWCQGMRYVTYNIVGQEHVVMNLENKSPSRKFSKRNRKRNVAIMHRYGLLAHLETELQKDGQFVYCCE